MSTYYRFITFFFIIMVLLVSLPVIAKSWELEKVTFETPYTDEQSMKLLIEYALGEYDMELVNNHWTVTLELSKGFYHYTFWDPTTVLDWDKSWHENFNKPVKYVGFQITSTKHFNVSYSGIPDKYVEAIIIILETAYQGYQEMYGIDLAERCGVEKFKVCLDVVPESNRQLFVEMKSMTIMFNPNSESLNSPSQGGDLSYSSSLWIYGFVHELGHLAIYSRTPANESFADVLAAYLIKHYLWPKLGPSAWPNPYNYNTYDREWSRKLYLDPRYSSQFDKEFTEFLWNLLDNKGPLFIGQIVNCLPYKNVTKDVFIQKVNEQLND